MRLDVAVADGRTARTPAEPAADVWIPDDAGWAGNPGPARLAGPSPSGGTVFAESPLPQTDSATAKR